MFSVRNVLCSTVIAGAAVEAVYHPLEDKVIPQLENIIKNSNFLFQTSASIIEVPCCTVLEIAKIFTGTFFGIGACWYSGKNKNLNKKAFEVLNESQLLPTIFDSTLSIICPPCTHKKGSSLPSLPSITSYTISKLNNVFDSLDNNAPSKTNNIKRRAFYALFAVSMIITGVPSAVMGIAAAVLAIPGVIITSFTGDVFYKLNTFACQELCDTLKFSGLLFCVIKFINPDAPLSITYSTKTGIQVKVEE